MLIVQSTTLSTLCKMSNCWNWTELVTKFLRGSFNKRSQLHYLSTFINEVAEKKPGQDFKGNRPRTSTEISLCHLENVTPSPSSWIAVLATMTHYQLHQIPALNVDRSIVDHRPTNKHSCPDCLLCFQVQQEDAVTILASTQQRQLITITWQYDLMM